MVCGTITKPWADVKSAHGFYVANFSRCYWRWKLLYLIQSGAIMSDIAAFLSLKKLALEFLAVDQFQIFTVGCTIDEAATYTQTFDGYSICSLFPIHKPNHHNSFDLAANVHDWYYNCEWYSKTLVVEEDIVRFV